MLRSVKKLISTLALAVLMLGVDGCASKQEAYDTTILQTAKILSALYKAPRRPWPQFNLLNHPILFVSFEEETLKRFIKSELQDLKFENWKSKIPRTKVDFDSQEIDGRRYLILHLDNVEELSSAKLVTIAIHEGFHNFGQIEWKQQKQSEGRGNIYPFKAIPRYYRWEMKTHLLNYFKSKKKGELQKYAYWYYKWKTNFPEEYNNYTDRFEGTAQYYTNAMMTIYNSQRKKAKVSPLEVFQNNKATNQSFRKMFNLSYESYVLGTLTGILLDEMFSQGWQKTAMLGPSSLELLARNFQPIRDSIEHKEQNEFVAASLREMRKVDGDGNLDRIISDLASPNKLKVVIPSKGLQFSSFSTEGVYRSFFNFPGIKDVEMIGLASTHTIRGRGFALEFKPKSYWVTAQQTPCGKKHSTILVFDKDTAKIIGNQIELPAPYNMKLKGQHKTVHNTRWFCVEIKKETP